MSEGHTQAQDSLATLGKFKETKWMPFCHVNIVSIGTAALRGKSLKNCGFSKSESFTGELEFEKTLRQNAFWLLMCYFQTTIFTLISKYPKSSRVASHRRIKGGMPFQSSRVPRRQIQRSRMRQIYHPKNSKHHQASRLCRKSMIISRSSRFLWNEWQIVTVSRCFK